MNENNKPRVIELDIIKDYRTLINWLFGVLIFVLILWAGTIGLFVWYLNQYVINGTESQSEDPQGNGEGDGRP